MPSSSIFELSSAQAAKAGTIIEMLELLDFWEPAVVSARTFLGCAFFVPNIVEAILEGRQPLP